MWDDLLRQTFWSEALVGSIWLYGFPIVFLMSWRFLILVFDILNLLLIFHFLSQNWDHFVSLSSFFLSLYIYCVSLIIIFSAKMFIYRNSVIDRCFNETLLARQKKTKCQFFFWVCFDMNKHPKPNSYRFWIDKDIMKSIWFWLVVIKVTSRDQT